MYLMEDLDFSLYDVLYLGIVAVLDEERLEGVEDENDELSHLEPGQVALPPQVGLDTWTQGGEEVVRVHHHVDARVEETAECCVTSPDKLKYFLFILNHCCFVGK